MPAQAPADIVDGIVARLEPMALGPSWQAVVIRRMLESALETYKDMDRGWVNRSICFKMYAYQVRDDPAKYWLRDNPFAQDDRLACAWHRVLEVLGPELGGSPLPWRSSRSSR